MDESICPVDDREKAAQADNASGRRRQVATDRPKAMTIRRIRQRKVPVSTQPVANPSDPMTVALVDGLAGILFYRGRRNELRGSGRACERLLPDVLRLFDL